MRANVSAQRRWTGHRPCDPTISQSIHVKQNQTESPDSVPFGGCGRRPPCHCSTVCTRPGDDHSDGGWALWLKTCRNSGPHLFGSRHRDLWIATPRPAFSTHPARPVAQGCLVTNDYWLSAGEWFFSLARSGGRFSIEPGRDRLFNPMPVFHVHAGVVALMPMLLSQGCVIRPEHFSAKRWWREVSTSRASIVHYIGAVPQALIAMARSSEERAHCVRFGFGAGMEPATRQSHVVDRVDVAQDHPRFDLQVHRCPRMA